MNNDWQKYYVGFDPQFQQEYVPHDIQEHIVKIMFEFVHDHVIFNQNEQNTEDAESKIE